MLAPRLKLATEQLRLRVATLGSSLFTVAPNGL
jgi:hypothetical protein